MYDNDHSDEELTYHYNNAFYSVKHGEYREALESCDTYLKLDPKEPEVWADKAEAHLRLKELSLSMAACVQALTHERHEETRKRVLPILDELCKVQEAEEMLQKQKRDLRAQADKHFAEKNYQETLKCLGQLLNLVSPTEGKPLEKEIADVLVHKAWILRRQGQVQASIACLRQASMFNPEHEIASQFKQYGPGEIPPKKLKRE